MKTSCIKECIREYEADRGSVDVSKAAKKELASMQARIAELERMVVGIDTMRNNPKGCQFVAVYNLSGELADVVEISGTPAMTTITTPTKLAK